MFNGPRDALPTIEEVALMTDDKVLQVIVRNIHSRYFAEEIEDITFSISNSEARKYLVTLIKEVEIANWQR